MKENKGFQIGSYKRRISKPKIKPIQTENGAKAKITTYSIKPTSMIQQKGLCLCITKVVYRYNTIS